MRGSMIRTASDDSNTNHTFSMEDIITPKNRDAFDLPECVRRLTSHQAGLYGIPDRGRIAVGACADLLLLDPATACISPPRRVSDLRDPLGVYGVFVNGVRV